MKILFKVYFKKSIKEIYYEALFTDFFVKWSYFFSIIRKDNPCSEM
jgi:hypothetical protein